ncbi:MAG: DUF222 domain-containing protein [Acidimicrobiales bacterium]
MAGVRAMGVVQKEIIDLFAELSDLPTDHLSSGEVEEYVIASQRIRSLADAHCIRSAGVLDRSKVWSVEGATSATAWITWRCRIPKSRATASVTAARDLRAMPMVERALLDGRLTADHVRRLADCQRTNPEEFADDEHRLIDRAASLRWSSFDRIVRYWRIYAAPDDAEGEAQRRRDERRVHCSRSFEGMVVVDAVLDPVNGEIFARELERLERELFDADLHEARERLGEGCTLDQLARTRAQRRADAMALMAARSAAKPPGATEPRILLQALVGEDSMKRMCELTSGQVVTPGELVPLLTWAELERIVFESPSRVLDVGVRQRIFRGATKTAVLVRHRECTHRTCEVRAERCEIDHVIPYAEGGRTVQDNGEPKCPFHHRRAKPPP